MNKERGCGAWGGGSSCYIKKVVWRPPPPQKETTLCRSWSYYRLSWVGLWGQREYSSAKSQAKALGRDGLDNFERQHRSPSLLAPDEWWGSRPVRGGRRNWETSVRTLASVSRAVGAAWSELVCQVVPPDDQGSPIRGLRRDPGQRWQETPYPVSRMKCQ